MLLALLPLGLAHGGGFELLAVSVSPDDPQQIWAVVEYQGIVWTTDGGATWTRACEQALGVSRVYDVLAGDDAAVVATLEGPVWVDQEVGGRFQPGFPEETYSNYLAPADPSVPGQFLVGAITGGFTRCDDAGCTPTSLNDPALFPKSIRAVEGGWYATTTVAETLVAELWWSDNADTWSSRYVWPDGDVAPQIVYAAADLLLVWLMPRDPGTASLVRSVDGGRTFSAVYTASVEAGLESSVVEAGGVLLWSDEVSVTLRSDDRGLGWEDLQDSLPDVLCASQDGARGVLCADHLVDGFDLATSDDGWTWTPIGCFEEATLASWAVDACAASTSAWDTAVSLGGGRCDVVINPPAIEADKTGLDGCGRGCDTGDRPLRATTTLIPLLLWRVRRSRGTCVGPTLPHAVLPADSESP